MDLIFRKGSCLNVSHGQPEVCWWPDWHITNKEDPWRCMDQVDQADKKTY